MDRPAGSGDERPAVVLVADECVREIRGFVAIAVVCVVARLVQDPDGADLLWVALVGAAVGLVLGQALGSTPRRRGVARVERFLQTDAVELRRPGWGGLASLLVLDVVLLALGLSGLYLAGVSVLVAGASGLDLRRVRRWERERGAGLGRVVPPGRWPGLFRSEEHVELVDASGPSSSRSAPISAEA